MPEGSLGNSAILGKYGNHNLQLLLVSDVAVQHCRGYQQQLLPGRPTRSMPTPGSFAQRPSLCVPDVHLVSEK